MRVVMILLLAGIFGWEIHAAELEFVSVSSDATHFVQGKKTPFTPWGFNYDRDHTSRLLEDYWVDDWSAVEQDFREMKKLGANVVRIHLQLGRFMNTPKEPNTASLHQLGLLVALSEKIGVYLDITGLGCYRKPDVPAWYDELSESARWKTQARFWRVVAKVCAHSPAIFCYDLMNEPVLPGKLHPATDWLGPPFAGKFYYVQYISRDLAGRTHSEVLRGWVKKLRAAIRSEDKKHLITVGLIPTTRFGVAPQELSDLLDFISIHVYPDHGKPLQSLGTLADFYMRKPIVIEETFPLHCSVPELRNFIHQSKNLASGWIGFYWGKTIDQYRGGTNMSDVLTLGWLEIFLEGPPVTHN